MACPQTNNWEMKWRAIAREKTNKRETAKVKRKVQGRSRFVLLALQWLKHKTLAKTQESLWLRWKKEAFDSQHFTLHTCMLTGVCRNKENTVLENDSLRKPDLGLIFHVVTLLLWMMSTVSPCINYILPLNMIWIFSKQSNFSEQRHNSRSLIRKQKPYAHLNCTAVKV